MSNSKHSSVIVSLVERAQQLEEAFNVTAEAFGRQTEDGFWMAMNPGWDTEAGRIVCVNSMIGRWHKKTMDKEGRPNTMFLVATIPDPSKADGQRVAGFAIWVQLSELEGFGESMPSFPFEEMYPDDATEQRFLAQATNSFFSRRREVLHKKASSPTPAVLVMDINAVLPECQGRGIGTALTKWGMEEARKRGIEAVMEASVMGRKVYKKLGFEQDGDEVQWTVDEEFQGRILPSNVFMRTW
jgi:ribosomal protein S18 acetylase RimI-like enzyme